MKAALQELFQSYGSHKLIVAGNFNVNFTETSHDRDELLRLFASFGLGKVFDQLSRVGKTSATCIVNIFQSDAAVIINSDTENRHLFDHYDQILTIPSIQQKCTHIEK